MQRNVTRTKVSFVFALLAVAVSGAWGLAGTASAQYTFCNKSSYALFAAIGYSEGQTLVTRGWWSLRAGECKRVLSDPVTPGRYFVYAEAIHGHKGEIRTWSGRTPLCVQEDSLFTLRDQDVCIDDPRRQRQFLPVDVAEGAGGTKTTEFTDEANYSIFAAEVAGVQRLLRDIDAFSGQVDGQIGQATRDALRRYQRSKGMGNAGSINDDVIDALIEDANKAETQRGFFICNKTMLPVWSAFAQPTGEDDNYRSTGWWRLESEECAKVRRGGLTANTSFYVYGVMEAENRSVPLAGGNTNFCIADVQFDANGDVACEESGYDTASFRRVDVSDEKVWTFNFTPELFNPDLADR